MAQSRRHNVLTRDIKVGKKPKSVISLVRKKKKRNEVQPARLAVVNPSRPLQTWHHPPTQHALCWARRVGVCTYISCNLQIHVVDT